MTSRPLLLLLLTALGTRAQNETTMATTTEVPEAPEVQAPLGKLKGSIMRSRLGADILAFRGVRFAEAPVGLQRFQPPVPVKPWDNVFDASEEGPACPQAVSEFQSEDCLRLNVYTTKISCAEDIVRRPVIVFFHPGGFYQWSSSSDMFGPQYLLDQEIVLVTANYRLASLGFMSTGDSLLPGNVGLKDQVEALRWVQKNIAAFGGDPGSVTIAGYSAGSWSVSLHLVSPMSKGLFHRAIIGSGSATFQELLPTNQMHLAKKQADMLSCPTDTTGNMLVCLNTKTAEEFAESIPKFFEWHTDPIAVWLPVVEPEVRGVERFLPAQPIDLIRQGKFNKVPIITGSTKNEFAGRIIRMTEEAKNNNGTTMFQELNDDWNRLAPIIFLYERDTNRSLEISQKLKSFYLNDKPVDLENSEGLANLFTDALIGYSEHRLVNLLADASNESVYYYNFAYEGPLSHVVWSDTKKPYGVVHMDDLLYLFKDNRFANFTDDSSDVRMIERLTSIWAHFAKTGMPMSDEPDDLFSNVTWSAFDKKDVQYLLIGSEMEMKSGLNDERMAVWDNLFPLPPVASVD